MLQGARKPHLPTEKPRARLHAWPLPTSGRRAAVPEHCVRVPLSGRLPSGAIATHNKPGNRYQRFYMAGYLAETCPGNWLAQGH